VYLWQAVQRLRADGVRVVQALPGQELCAAAVAGCDRQLRLLDGRWQVAPLAL
jgi:ATP phosphoribosyltransferase regulatory subunit